MRILENKSDLDDSSESHTHEGISKHGVRRSTDHQILRVRRHGPASNKDHESWDEVAFGASVTILAQPNTSQTGAPPDDAHSRMLPVILDPRATPAVLGKRIDAAPCSYHGTIVKLLRASAASNP